MKTSKTIFFFEHEHHHTLKQIYQYYHQLFPCSLSYPDFVHFAYNRSTIDHSLAHLYQQYTNEFSNYNSELTEII